MGVYLILFGVLFFITIHGMGKRMMFLIMIVMSFILGFRSESIGTDTYGYIDYYNSLSLDIYSGYMEKGWNLIAVICKFFNLSAYGFHFIIALLTFLPICLMSLEFNDNRINGYVLFFLFTLGYYFHMFNIMRQLLAMSIVLLGYAKLVQGKKILFLFLVAIASFVHIASFFAFFMVLFDRINFSTKAVVYILLVSFVVGIVASESFFLFFAGKYAHDIDDFGFRSSLSFLLIVGLLTNLFTLWLYKMVPELSDNAWVKFNILSVVIFNLLSNLVLGARLVYFFSICSIFAYSLYAVNANRKIVTFVIYLFASITFARYLVPEMVSYGMDGSLVPYTMNFQLFAE